MQTYNQMPQGQPYQAQPTSFGGGMDANLIDSQYAEATTTPQYKAKTPFNVKNYLNDKLGQNEAQKTLRIRLLPFSPTEGTPFHKMKVHNVMVNPQMSAGKWKTFVCPKNEDPNAPCPYCELAAKAKESKKNAFDETTKKTYNDIEFMNMAKDAWFVRCIDRDHEYEGVKFWKFNHAGKKKDGVYDAIMNIYNLRRKENINIFDLNQGKDLLVTITKDSRGHTVRQVTDASTLTPLTTNYELGMSWINDKKTVAELYPIKAYDYMLIAANGGVPKFDQNLNKYIDLSKVSQEKQEAREKQIQENYTQPTVDLSQPTMPTYGTNGVEKGVYPQSFQQPTQPVVQPVQQGIQSPNGYAYGNAQNNTQWQQGVQSPNGYAMGNVQPQPTNAPQFQQETFQAQVQPQQYGGQQDKYEDIPF